MPSPYVADVTPLLQGLTQFTPRGREDRAYEMEKREQNATMNELALKNAQATQKRNQLTDVAKQNFAMLTQKKSDIDFSMKDGAEGLLNNLTILARDKDPESMELKNIIDIRNLAVSDPEAAFARIQDENLMNVTRGLEVTNKIITGLNGRGAAGFSAKTTSFNDGTSIQFDNQGKRVVTAPDGTQLTGQEAAAQIEKARTSGVSDQAERAGARAGATKTEGRASELITRGIAAAESTATIRRAMSLLDKVKTGGINSISLAVKQRLGIEGADEGELSNSLGKSVLSQLRETFGAAFTESEGQRLERIEAGFGKSPATNRRLLKQALAIAERTAKRASREAKKRGTGEDVDITDLLAFSLDDTGDGEEAVAGEETVVEVTTQDQFNGLPSGAIYTESGVQYRKP